MSLLTSTFHGRRASDRELFARCETSVAERLSLIELQLTLLFADRIRSYSIPLLRFPTGSCTFSRIRPISIGLLLLLVANHSTASSVYRTSLFVDDPFARSEVSVRTATTTTTIERRKTWKSLSSNAGESRRLILIQPSQFRS